MDKNLRVYISLLIIVLFGVLILYMLRDYISTIFAALVLSYLVFPIYKKLNKKIKSETTCALIIILGLLLLVLIPLSAVVGTIVSQINNYDTDSEKLMVYEESISNLLGREVNIADTIENGVGWIRNELSSTLPKIVSVTSNFFLSTFIMFFIMFYVLIQNQTIVKELRHFIPFSDKNSKYLMDESGKVVNAVFIGQILTAVIQGTLGMAAFIAAGIEGAVVWGLIMIILSIIPLVGAFIIFVPAGLLLILEGSMIAGIGVLLWGFLVVSQVDNLVRPKLVGRFADIHPLETFIGIFIGIAQFGIVGIILGPLIISIFKLMIIVYRREYLNS